MSVDLTAAIVRILNPGSLTVGTGFLVTDDGLVATCAHVLRAAGVGTGDWVTIAFHTVDEERRGRVEPEWWRDAEDVAILHLERLLPAGVTPVALGAAEGERRASVPCFWLPRRRGHQGLVGHERDQGTGVNPM